jgi:hypothetical protein
VPSHRPGRRIANRCGAATQASRFRSPKPIPSLDIAPAATGARLGAISRAIPKIANPNRIHIEVNSDTGPIT